MLICYLIKGNFFQIVVLFKVILIQLVTAHIIFFCFRQLLML